MILFQSTKNLPIKGLSYLLISLFICSCSPTLYVLDKNPQLAGRIYKTISLAKVDKRLKNNPNDLEALILNVESLTTYAFGFLIESKWDSFIEKIKFLAEISLAIAMSAVGLSTRFSLLKSMGLKPFYVGFAAACSVSIFSFVGIRFIF